MVGISWTTETYGVKNEKYCSSILIFFSENHEFCLMGSYCSTDSTSVAEDFTEEMPLRTKQNNKNDIRYSIIKVILNVKHL